MEAKRKGEIDRSATKRDRAKDAKRANFLERAFLEGRVALRLIPTAVSFCGCNA